MAVGGAGFSTAVVPKSSPKSVSKKTYYSGYHSEMNECGMTSSFHLLTV